MRKSLWLCLALGLVGCKTVAQNSSVASADGATLIPCDGAGAFVGVCAISDVTGRLETTTEVARGTRLKEVEEIRFEIPAREAPTQTLITFHKVKGEKSAWRISEALDLYDRRQCIAQLSGGVFDEGFTPRFTFRALFNVRNSSRTGFAEVTEYAGGKPVHATVTLECDWSR